jgi:hypothetical protein
MRYWSLIGGWGEWKLWGGVSRRRNPPTRVNPRGKTADYAPLIRPTSYELVEAASTRLIESHADKRHSAEPAEGLASFAERRPARWG